MAVRQTETVKLATKTADSCGPARWTQRTWNYLCVYQAQCLALPLLALQVSAHLTTAYAFSSLSVLWQTDIHSHTCVKHTENFPGKTITSFNSQVCICTTCMTDHHTQTIFPKLVLYWLEGHSVFICTVNIHLARKLHCYSLLTDCPLKPQSYIFRFFAPTKFTLLKLWTEQVTGQFTVC